MITTAMGKKRRTKQQKIISKLRKELAQQRTASAKKIQSKPTNIVSQKTNKKSSTLSTLKNTEAAEKMVFAYDPELIKKDLIKTLLLSFIFLSVITILKFTLKM